MIQDAASARERVRLILDRANSPWLANSEINGFIEMAINEYVRERVNDFEANQKIRDDFGQFVKSIVFSKEPEESGTDGVNANGTVFRRQFINYLADGTYDSDAILDYNIEGGEWGGVSGNATGVSISDSSFLTGGEEEEEEVEVDDEIHFGYLLEVKIYTPGSGALKICKIMSIDDTLSASKDPFNKPGATADHHAVRVGNVYWIRPGVGNSARVILTFVSNDNRADNISWLPLHGREEVCQVAARKIMGTVADERVSLVDNEVKQLEGK